MNLKELAWAAGFYDGEGCTYVRPRRNGNGPYVRITITQTDRRPLDRWIAAVEAGHINGPYHKKGGGQLWKDYYVVQISNRQDIQAVHSKLWKFLSGPKREQIARCIRQVTLVSE